MGRAAPRTVGGKSCRAACAPFHLPMIVFPAPGVMCILSPAVRSSCVAPVGWWQRRATPLLKRRGTRHCSHVCS